MFEDLGRIVAIGAILSGAIWLLPRIVPDRWPTSAGIQAFVGPLGAGIFAVAYLDATLGP